MNCVRRSDLGSICIQLRWHAQMLVGRCRRSFFALSRHNRRLMRVAQALPRSCGSYAIPSRRLARMARCDGRVSRDVRQGFTRLHNHFLATHFLSKSRNPTQSVHYLEKSRLGAGQTDMRAPAQLNGARLSCGRTRQNRGHRRPDPDRRAGVLGLPEGGEANGWDTALIGVGIPHRNTVWL